MSFRPITPAILVYSRKLTRQEPFSVSQVFRCDPIREHPCEVSTLEKVVAEPLRPAKEVQISCPAADHTFPTSPESQEHCSNLSLIERSC